MSRRLLTLAATAALAASLLALTACSSGGDSPARGSSNVSRQVGSYEADEIVTVPTRWATAIAQNLSTLTASSDAVFTGRVLRLKEQRQEQFSPASVVNPSPVDGKPSRQAPTFPISTYEVLVEEHASGWETAPPSLVLIEQGGGVVEQADGSRIRLVLDGDEPLETGQRYLFFALRKENGTFSAAPFARLAVEGERLEPGQRWSALGAMKALSGKSVAEALMLVQAAGGR